MIFTSQEDFDTLNGMKSELAALRAENDRLKAEAVQDSNEAFELCERVKRLREALEKYGRHLLVCKYRNQTSTICDCGYTAALRDGQYKEEK